MGCLGLTGKSAVRGVVEAVAPVVLLQFSGLSLFLGFTAAASFRFLLAGVFFRAVSANDLSERAMQLQVMRLPTMSAMC